LRIFATPAVQHQPNGKGTIPLNLCDIRRLSLTSTSPVNAPVICLGTMRSTCHLDSMHESTRVELTLQLAVKSIPSVDELMHMRPTPSDIPFLEQSIYHRGKIVGQPGDERLSIVSDNMTVFLICYRFPFLWCRLQFLIAGKMRTSLEWNALPSESA
jgi:hypothetical protein